MDLREQTTRTSNGLGKLLLAIGLFVAGAALIAIGAVSERPLLILPAVILKILGVFTLIGLYTIQPNKAAVIALFGDYRGTDRTPGLRWANPFFSKQKVSLRVRNFTTQTSKVNDANGNPILIGAVVVWKVTDTARAVFGVDDFEDYVFIQSESALRQIARSYPYDCFDNSEATTLIGDTGDVNDHLRNELQERADDAGVEIIETRITDLSYAPEIAEAMLRRQQAAAIVSARQKIVEGAVGMVQDAIEALQAGTHGEDAIELDNERKATFASNLMTVIACDQPTSPVVNVGTLNR